jgi:hypothetical protein
MDLKRLARLSEKYPLLAVFIYSDRFRITKKPMTKTFETNGQTRATVGNVRRVQPQTDTTISSRTGLVGVISQKI